MRSLTRIGLALLFFLQLSPSGFAQTGIITTYVGPGLPVMGAQAITQPIDRPVGVALDRAGGFYVASTSQNRVYRVVAGGTISLIAGSSAPGYSGDGGPASSAQLFKPTGIAVDSAGDLFIADNGNNCVRKVTAPSGVISTVAGNGTGGFSGDGGPATSAQLNSPTGVAVDTAGNLFIADCGNNRIRKVTPGGVISTVAGNGTGGFSGDGGPATLAWLNSPTGVAVDTAGNLFLADLGNQRVRKVGGGSSVSVNLTLSPGGSVTSSTAGANGTTQTGYATVAVSGGAASYATAAFDFNQNGVTVREASVPASRTSDTGAAPNGAAVFSFKQNGVAVHEAGVFPPLLLQLTQARLHTARRCSVSTRME